MGKISAIILLSASLCAVSAGENDVGRYNIGLAAGFTTGYGLSYRQWFDNGYGLQLTCGPYYDKTTSSTDASVSTGVTGLKVINSVRGLNLFGYVSAHMHYSYSMDTVYLDIYPESSVSETTTLYIGGGPGLDFHTKRVSFSVMTGLMYNTTLQQSSVHFGLTVETALYYSF